MTKSKVLDLAREVGMEDDKLRLKLKRMGVKVKDKRLAEPEKKVSLSDEKIIERDSEKEIIEKRVKPTVIRRRARTLEVKVEIPPPPLAVVEAEAIPEIIKEKIPKVKEKEGKGELEAKLPTKAVEEKELKKEEKPPSKPTEEKKTKETPAELTIPVGAKAEGKEILTSRPVEAGQSQVALNEKVEEDEREGEKVEGKEVEVSFNPFRPMKKKVVLKTPKKTEVTVPKPIKRIIRIAEVISVGDLAKRMEIGRAHV